MNIRPQTKKSVAARVREANPDATEDRVMEVSRMIHKRLREEAQRRQVKRDA